MEHPHVSDYDIVQNPGHTLRHLHYGFEITPLSNEFIRTTSIACVCSKNIMIASGNLEQWRTVVLNDTPALRPIVNRVMLLLEAEGLSRLWLGYQKVKVDNVFKLERRRS